MTRPNLHIALIYHYDLARALNGEPVDWQAIPVNVDAGREGGDLCRAAADFARRRDLFAMPAPMLNADEVAQATLGVLKIEAAGSGDTGAPVGQPLLVAAPAAPNAVGQPVAEPEPVAPARSAAHGSATNFDDTTRLIFDDTDIAPDETHSILYDPPESPAHRDRLRARIADLIDQGHGDRLRIAWPDGVPTLKHEGHNPAQLELILFAVKRIEAEVGASWHPDDGPPPHVNTDPRASVKYPTAAVEEGGPITASDHELLQREFDALGPVARELCIHVAAGAHDAGRSISVSANPTVRRWTIARAVIAWAAAGRSVDDLWFTASLLATHQQTCDADATLGGLISQFTIEQAERLYEAAGQVAT